MPTIYLASAAQTNADRKRGLPVGHRLTIMHSPNTERGETGLGRVPVLTPTDAEWYDLGRPLIEARRHKRPLDPADVAAYRGALETRWAAADLSPGVLLAHAYTGQREPVPDGAVLMCACSRAHAAAGECHRVWAAPFLVRAGWTVILDGADRKSVV